MTVDRLLRKPCWCSAGRSDALSAGRRSRSKIFTAGTSSEIGLYEELIPAGLPGFRTGIITEDFHMDGISALAKERLKTAVKNSMPRGPRRFRCHGARPSGPVAVEFLETLIASAVSAAVKKV